MFYFVLLCKRLHDVSFRQESNSIYLEDLLNIENPLEQMVSPIYSDELQLNTAYLSDTEAPFWTGTCP